MFRQKCFTPNLGNKIVISCENILTQDDIFALNVLKPITETWNYFDKQLNSEYVQCKEKLVKRFRMAALLGKAVSSSDAYSI